MEQVLQVVVNNGLGVASFLALIYFYNTYLSQISETNKKICSTLDNMEKRLTELYARVYELENKNNKF